MKIRGDIEVTPRFNNGNGGITIERERLIDTGDHVIPTSAGLGLLSLEDALQLAIEILHQRATITRKPLAEVLDKLNNDPRPYLALQAGDVIAAFHRAEDLTPRKTT